MKYRSLWIVLLALLIAGSAYPSNVTEVTLSHANGSTVANIRADGPVRYIHQVVGPKDGKPYRVIVDVLAASHALGQQSFMKVPAACPISAVRTSQYAVAPEKICRLVFDMREAPLYQVKQLGNEIHVIFTYKNGKPYPDWSTSQFAKPKTAVVRATTKATPKVATAASKSANEKIQKDRQSSLTANKAASSKPMPSMAGKQTTTAAVPSQAGKPASSPEKAQSSTAPKKVIATTKAVPSNAGAKQPSSKKPATVAAKPKAQPTSTPATAKPKSAPKKAVPSNVAANKKATSPDTKKAVPTQAAKPVPSAAKSASGQQALAKKIQKSKPTDAKPSVAAAKPKPKVKAEQEPAAAKPTQKVAQAKPTQPKTRTSRFRRNPGQSAKMAGTMVAEFPKRLVIKYKAGKLRDPFETLINDTKTENNPIARRIPNVEGLKLVGIIEAENGANQALFEDVDNYSYILKSGDKVKKGYVLRVENDRVYFQIFEYGWSRTVALRIEQE